MTTGIRLFDDSIPTVRALRADGVKTALVSNCSHNTRPVVARLGLEQEFDALILSFEVGSRKPQPAIYRALSKRSGARPRMRSSSTTKRTTATVPVRSGSIRA
jgi:Predicted hydrolase (HAD superfamily)